MFSVRNAFGRPSQPTARQSRQSVERTLDYLEIQRKISKHEFDEVPVCNFCGSADSTQAMEKDGFCVAECTNCKLWFTSPRLNQTEWEAYLRYPYTPRNIAVTENRLHYGVAVPGNAGANKPSGKWRLAARRRNIRRIEMLQERLGRPIRRIHDCGCGVGYFVQDALEFGLDASGNDLNGYACKVMQEELQLNVHLANIGELPFPAGSIDVVFMNDFIEHTYHPLEDLKAAANLLTPGGVIFLETFYLDSPEFQKRGADWGMLTWPHLYHFTSTSLKAMVEAAGLKIEFENLKENGIIELVGRK